MPKYQIGTEEPRECVGSRAAKSEELAEALKECQEYSLSRHIKSAWLREFNGGSLGLGPVIIIFKKGIIQ